MYNNLGRLVDDLIHGINLEYLQNIIYLLYMTMTLQVTEVLIATTASILLLLLSYESMNSFLNCIQIFSIYIIVSNY